MVTCSHIVGKNIRMDTNGRCPDTISLLFNRSIASSGDNMQIIGKVVLIDYWINDSDISKKNRHIKLLLDEICSDPILSHHQDIESLKDSFSYEKDQWHELKQSILTKLPVGPGVIQTHSKCEVAVIKSQNLPPLLKEQIRTIHKERMKQSVGKALGFSDSWGPENSVDHLEQQGTSIIVIIDTLSTEWTVQGYMILLENPPGEILSDKAWEALSSLDESLKIDFKRVSSKSHSSGNKADPRHENFGSILADGFFWLQAVAVSKSFSNLIYKDSGMSTYARMFSGLNSLCYAKSIQSILVGHCPVGINENTAFVRHEDIGCVFDNSIIHTDPRLSIIDEFNPETETGLAMFWTLVGSYLDTRWKLLG
jgi:hypothetical protein